MPRHGEPGIETWQGTEPITGGGSTWLTGSYDPSSGTLYWATGNPWPDGDDRDRPGDNLYTDSVLALNARTGEMKWYYQFTPHDLKDRDATEPNVLIDSVYKGKPAKLLLHADRNGFFYVLDRTNGKLLLAKPFLRRVDWAKSIGADGRPVVADPRGCPSDAANWDSTAFSPATRLYYFIALEECVGKPTGYPDQTGQRFLARDQHRIRGNRVGGSAARTRARKDLVWRTGYRRRSGVLRAAQWRLRGSRSADRQNALEIPHERSDEGVAHDLYRGWKAVHRRGCRPEHPLLRFVTWLCYRLWMPTALITGTSTGIGRETALHFARQGYRVFAGARNPAAIEEHPNIIAVKLDVDQDESVREAVGRVQREAGAIDVLVNNAGVGFAGAVEYVPLEKIRAGFETNFYGAVRMMQAVLPAMRERRSGTIVNVASIMGRLTLGCHAFYAATKFALAAVSEALAIEIRPFGVRVVIIEPGVIITPIWNKAEASMPEGHPYGLAMGRLWRLFEAQLAEGTMPDTVALAIYDAVHTAEPKLRYPVGADAEAMAAARDRLSAAEWLDLQSEPDDEKFLARARETFGVNLYEAPSLHARRKGLPR